MPGALFSRIKTWITGETLTASDLNTEFDNVLNNLDADKISGHSHSLSQMKLTTDPGDSEEGNESLAGSTAGEIERLRFAIGEIKGTTEWYDSPSTDLASLLASGSTPQNRVVSGATRADSAQHIFLIPDGTTAEATLDADPVPLQFAVNNQVFEISSDITISGLPITAGGAADQMQVNDTTLAGAEETKVEGERNTELVCNTIGANIPLAGDWYPFKINNGVDDEYFFAYIKENTGASVTLTHCYRGFFFDDLSAPVDRITISHTDTITLLRTAWIFAKTDLSLAFVNTTPVISAIEPATASSGDYWLDLSESKWKVNVGGNFQDADATLIGITIQDNTACIGARAFDSARLFGDECSVNLTLKDANTVRTQEQGNRVNIYGQLWDFGHELVEWDIEDSNHLESGKTEAANTNYYLYATNTCRVRISDTPPYHRKDLRGYYHPHHTWRAVGVVRNDSSSDFRADELKSYGDQIEEVRFYDTGSATGNFDVGGFGWVNRGSATIHKANRGPVLLGLNNDASTLTSAIRVQENTQNNGTVVYMRIDRNGVMIRQGILWATQGFGAGAGQRVTNRLFMGLLHADLDAPAGRLTYDLYFSDSANQNGSVDAGVYFYALEL